MSLPEHVAGFLSAHGIDGPLVVGVSGGPDSTALLRALVAAGADVHAAHLDHGLRAGGGADAKFVAGLAAELGVPATFDRVDARAAHDARRGGSLENTGRELRRAFLEEVAAGGWIALGHTADDQAETVLLHLLRGAGPAGLGGMRPVTGRYIRPLLDLPRADVLAYLDAHGWPYRVDETNRDLAFTRNRIRHELLPALAAFNPRIVEALGRTAGLMRLVDEWTEAEVDAHLPAGDELPVATVAAVPRYLALALVRRLAGTDLSADHAAAVADLASSPTGARVELPGGITATRAREAIRIGRDLLPPPADAAVPVPGTVVWGDAELTFDDAAPPGEPATGPAEAYLDADRIRPPLLVRSRRPGDRFHPLGAPGAQKLKQFLADRHVPRELRDRVPLLVDGGGIVCVVGHRIAERVKVGPATTRYLHVRVAPRGPQAGVTAPTSTAS